MAKTPAGADRRAALQAAKVAEAKAQRQRRQLVIGAVVVGLAALLAFGGWWFLRPKPVAEVTGTPAHAVATSGIAVNPGKAKAGAPKVTVYSDFQCPWCKRFDQGLGPEFMKLARSGDIALEYRTITFLEEGLRNDSSTRAAEAAACADMASVDRYPEVLEAIYAAQPEKEGAGYPADVLRNQVPKAVGITGPALDAYQRCVDERTMTGFVPSVDKAGRASLAAANKGQVSTPTYLVNGHVLDLSPLHDQKTKSFNAAGLAEAIRKAA